MEMMRDEDIPKYVLHGFHDFAEQCFEKGITPEQLTSYVLCRIVLGLADSRPHDEVREFMIDQIDQYLRMRAKDVNH
jgi:hypothetical protein